MAAGEAFGSDLGSSRWNIDADLNGDDYIGVIDIALIARNFGQQSQWEDITTFIDVEANVAFGLGSHFLIQGVTRWSFD